jgi:hypothetical protein
MPTRDCRPLTIRTASCTIHTISLLGSISEASRHARSTTSIRIPSSLRTQLTAWAICSRANFAPSDGRKRQSIVSVQQSGMLFGLSPPRMTVGVSTTWRPAAGDSDRSSCLSKACRTFSIPLIALSPSSASVLAPSSSRPQPASRPEVRRYTIYCSWPGPRRQGYRSRPQAEFARWTGCWNSSPSELRDSVRPQRLPSWMRPRSATPSAGHFPFPPHRGTKTLPTR